MKALKQNRRDSKCQNIKTISNSTREKNKERNNYKLREYPKDIYSYSLYHQQRGSKRLGNDNGSLNHHSLHHRAEEAHRNYRVRRKSMHIINLSKYKRDKRTLIKKEGIRNNKFLRREGLGFWKLRGLKLGF